MNAPLLSTTFDAVVLLSTVGILANCLLATIVTTLELTVDIHRAAVILPFLVQMILGNAQVLLTAPTSQAMTLPCSRPKGSHRRAVPEANLKLSILDLSELTASTANSEVLTALITPE
jgi:hypothetical protein